MESRGVPDGLEIVHKIVMTGRFFFSKIIGGKIKAGLPVAVGKLIEIAEKADYAGSCLRTHVIHE